MTKTKIRNFFVDLVDEQGDVATYGAPPKIVWLGRYNLPATVTHYSIVNRVNERIAEICEEDYGQYCVYVDTRGAWSVEDTDLYLLSSEQDPYASDGPIHVNEMGGEIIANRLWEVISNPTNEIFF